MCRSRSCPDGIAPSSRACSSWLGLSGVSLHTSFRPSPLRHGLRLPGRAGDRVPVLIASRRTERDQYPGLGWAAGRSPGACRAGRPRSFATPSGRAVGRRGAGGPLRRHPNGVEPLRPTRRARRYPPSPGLSVQAPVVGSVGRLVPAKDYPLRSSWRSRSCGRTRRPPSSWWAGIARDGAAGPGPPARPGAEGPAHGRARRRRGPDERARRLPPDLDREGMPNAVMEAMTLGLPASSRTPGQGRGCRAREDRVRLPGGRPGRTRRERPRLLDDPGLRAQLGASGRTRMASDFTPERMAAATGALYGHLLATKVSGAPAAEADCEPAGVSAVTPVAHDPRALGTGRRRPAGGATAGASDREPGRGGHVPGAHRASGGPQHELLLVSAGMAVLRAFPTRSRSRPIPPS